jgi:hypothetical protein
MVAKHVLGFLLILTIVALPVAAASRVDAEMGLLERKASGCDRSLIEYGPSSAACEEFSRFREQIFPDGASAYMDRNAASLSNRATMAHFIRSMSRTNQTMRRLVGEASR